MLRVGIHITVTTGDGSPMVEITSTQTVISPDHKNALREIEAGIETLDRIVNDAREQYHVQMMDFGKVVADQ